MAQLNIDDVAIDPVTGRPRSTITSNAPLSTTRTTPRKSATTSSGGGGSSTTTKDTPTTTAQMQAALISQYPTQFEAIKKMTAAELASMYGIMYKREDIEGVLNEATTAKFNELDAQTRSLRDRQLTDYASQYNQYLLNARQNRQNSLKSGLSRGSNVARDVMSQLSAQQQGAENQTAYQQGLADLVNQRGTQLGADKYNALAMSNEIGNNLANIAANYYQSDVAGLTGYQQYLASLANSQATLGAAGVTADATKYAANQTYNAANLTIQQQKELSALASKLGLSDTLLFDVLAGNTTAAEASNTQKSDAAKQAEIDAALERAKNPSTPSYSAYGTIK